MKSLEDVRTAILAFSEARDWGQFHSPKNLTMALSVETAELVEHFQWLTEAESESAALSAPQSEAVRDEIADVLYYLVLLSDRLGIDMLEAAARKMEKNEQKYPVSKSRGTALKYTELD